MHTGKYQQGITLFGFLFILFLIGFTAFTTFKLFPVYMENFSIRSSLESTEQEQGVEYRGALAVRNAVFRRFSINNVTQVSKDDISIIRDGQVYLIDVDYEVRVPYISNISLLVSFKNHAEVDAQ